MSRTFILKYGLFLTALVLLFYTLIFTTTVHTETFDVTNEDELREALSIAESNGEDDTIHIAAGLYRTSGEPFTFTSSENQSLMLEGQGSGQTILDGGSTSQILSITSEAESHFLEVSVQGLTIQNGFTRANGAGLNVYIYDGFLTLENCEFINNYADINNSYGGGIYINAIHSVIQEIRSNAFRNNSAQFGGGLFSTGRSLSITNNSFTNNFAKLDGGGIAIYWSNTVFVINNTFLENSASRDGGCGRYLEVTNLDTSNNEFRRNISGNNGGCTNADGFGVNMYGNEFYDNSTVYSGGGAYVFAEQASIGNNLFVNNSNKLESDFGGGGIAVQIKGTDYAFSQTVNNIFSQNKSASHGGGMAIMYEINSTSFPPLAENMMNLTNNTFTLNTAELNGGGVGLLKFYTDKRINIYNNIIFDNTASNNGSDIFVDDDSDLNNIGSNIFLFNNDLSDFFSVCENTLSCTPNINEANNINEDPMFVDVTGGDYGLMSNSPAIDAGDPDAPSLPKANGVSWDYFSNPRGPIPDMGAVEYIAEAANNGGCSLTTNPASSSLAVIPALPLLILIWRIAKKHKTRREKEVSI